MTQYGHATGLVNSRSGIVAPERRTISEVEGPVLARRNAPTVYPANYQGRMPSGGYVSGAKATPGLESNILSGLATGAALGAGMVAGEELVHHFTDGNANAAPAYPPMTDSWESDPVRLSGRDFGIADNSTWDDGSNLADISGGDDWT